MFPAGRMRIPAHLSKDACLGYKCFLFGVCRRGWTKSEINLFSCRARGTRSSPGVICFSISCNQLYKSPQPSPLGQGSSTEGTWMANTGLHEISGIPQNMCSFSRGDCMAYISSYQKQSLRTTILNGEMKSDQELGELHSVVDGEQLGGSRTMKRPPYF